jgi:hypothetical protein
MRPLINWIAETVVVWVDSDGVRRPGRIAVSMPARRPTGEWDCVALVDVGSTRGFPIFGVDSFQALMLALQFIGYELDNLVSSGWRAVYPHTDAKDVEFDLGRLMGPLLRPPLPLEP